jgi:hypothetical protein
MPHACRLITPDGVANSTRFESTLDQKHAEMSRQFNCRRNRRGVFFR